MHVKEGTATTIYARRPNGNICSFLRTVLLRIILPFFLGDRCLIAQELAVSFDL